MHDKRGRRNAEIEEKEWDALGLFLRKLYDEGNDMSFLARNLDSSKKSKTKELADTFRSTVKEADRPTRQRDRRALVAAFDESAGEVFDRVNFDRGAGLLDAFLELLQDVPDEL